MVVGLARGLPAPASGSLPRWVSPPRSPAQWDLVNTIRCSGETLLTLITDILDFSRIEADKMVLNRSEFRLQTVIEAAIEIAGLHAAQKRLQVAYNIADSGTWAAVEEGAGRRGGVRAWTSLVGPSWDRSGRATCALWFAHVCALGNFRV